jgi:hypothetical protein
MWTRRTILALAGFGSLAGLTALLQRRESVAPPVFTGIVAGVAVGGYDPVAYFMEGRPMHGSPEISITYDGVIWRFSKPEHRTLFLADPERYAPRYGGYCAYAVAGGGIAAANPEHWRIVDGRLYLNASARVHDKWLRDAERYIAKANANWPSALRKQPASL